MTRRTSWIDAAVTTALVVAPAVALVWIAVAGFARQEATVRDTVVAGIRELARAKGEAASREALAAEDAALRTVAGPDGKNVLNTLRTKTRRPDLVEEFFLASPEGDILFPVDLRGTQLILTYEARPEDAEGRSTLDEARRLERAGKRADALAAYARVCLPPYGHTLRVEALTELGASQFSAKEFPQAAATWRRIAAEIPVGYVDPAVRVLAPFQVAASLEGAGQDPQAEAEYRGMLADALGETPTLPIVPATRYFVGQALARLRGMAAAGRLSAEGKAALAELGRLEKAKLEPGGVNDTIRSWVLPAIRRDGLPAEGTVRDLFEVIDGKPTLVAVRQVKEGGRALALGCVVRIDRLATLLGPLLDPGPGMSFALVHGTTRLLGPPGEAVARVAAPPPLDFAEVAAIPLSPDTVEGPVRRQRLQGRLLLGLLAVVLGVGVFATIRGRAQARRFARLQADFVARVSHDLKTPLALIRLFAETLLRPGGDAAKSKEYHGIILRESERLTQMVNNLLDFSRVQDGRRVYQRKPDDLARIVREVADALRPRFAEEGFQLAVDVPKGEVIAAVDGDAVASAIVNLLDNARKYSGEGREVRLSLAATAERARIEVADRGIGIPDGDREQVFERFRRGSDPRVQEQKGAGLGLALVRHVAEGHGGRAWVEPNDGKGTRSVVELPR